MSIERRTLSEIKAELEYRAYTREIRSKIYRINQSVKLRNEVIDRVHYVAFGRYPKPYGDRDHRDNQDLSVAQAWLADPFAPIGSEATRDRVIAEIERPFREAEALEAVEAVKAGRASTLPKPNGAGLTDAEARTINTARNEALWHSEEFIGRTGKDSDYAYACSETAADAAFRACLAARPVAPGPWSPWPPDSDVAYWEARTAYDARCEEESQRESISDSPCVPRGARSASNEFIRESSHVVYSLSVEGRSWVIRRDGRVVSFGLPRERAVSRLKRLALNEAATNGSPVKARHHSGLVVKERCYTPLKAREILAGEMRVADRESRVPVAPISQEDRDRIEDEVMSHTEDVDARRERTLEGGAK